MERREELADELTAILGASRELTPDTDRFLAERFVDQLDSRALGTSRRRRSISRRARTPRRQLAAVLVAGVALAIGIPFSLQSIRTQEQPYSTACSWQSQTLVFDSRSTEGTWQYGLNPKSLQVVGMASDPTGKVTIQAIHRECG
jgi:ferric-dicitrate binding protein FerR (iron transport regulator)